MTKNKYIGVEISRTNNVLKRNCNTSELSRELEQATGKNGWIIGFIAENSDKDIFQRDIEEKFSIRRSTVSSMLQLMEKKGFVVRESVSYDARLKKLTLTPKAWEMQKKMLEGLDGMEKRLRSGLTEEEVEQFFRLIEKIRNNAEKREENECSED